MLRSALKFIVGAAIGVFLWSWCGPLYNALLARAAEPIMRLDARLRNGEIAGAGPMINARGSEAQPDLPRIIIPADQLTYNVILFLGLFATNPRAFRDRGALRFTAVLAVLFVTHVLAVAVTIESTYATKLGPWSEAHYGPMEQDFWAAAEYAYRLAGMFGVAFGCWWVTRGRGAGGRL